MPLKIKHVGFADLKRLVEIEVAAFEGLEVFPLLCPGGVNASRQQAMRLAIKGVMVHDTTARYMKVTSTEEHDKIIAFAKWHIPTKLRPRMTSSTTDPRAKYQLDALGLKNQPGGLNKLLSSQSSNSRQRIMGQKPHCYLDRLATDPHYQRQGAAGSLLRMMCQTADELQLPSYLESSPAGYSLYKKHGFVEVETAKVDLRPWGGMSDYIMKNMVRPAVHSA